MERLIRFLSDELKKPLPGPAAHNMMAPAAQRPPVTGMSFRRSAVTILLYKQKEQIHTVFIKRVEYEGIHSGQISFPGGMEEDFDISLAATALRETEEEIGVPSGSISIIGSLTPLHINVSNTEVHPFIAVANFSPGFTPDPSEVQYVIEVPLTELTSTVCRKREIISAGGFSIDAPYYELHDGNHIWGATAMILSEFLEITGKRPR